jgi:tRNA isopentenyl-2-thiomethyl-A-37 hydroxylase MiaE
MTRKVTEEDVPPIAELFKERLHHFELLEEIIEKVILNKMTCSYCVCVR